MAFTKKDILVILGCVVFLLASIGAIGSGGRRRAKEAVCLSNLHQWGGIFERYTKEHDGYFYEGRGWNQHPGHTGHEQNGWWMNALRPYYCDNWNLLLCPQASIAAESPHDSAIFRAYKMTLVNRYPAPNEGTTKTFTASYGENSWVSYMLADQNVIRKFQYFWKNVSGIKNKDNIPVFGDNAWLDAYPFHTDSPPPTQDFWQIRMYGLGLNELDQFCLDRHNAGINMLFMDWSARKVGLKELWTLKWHREFNTQNPWTKAGGVQPEDWPLWMRNFKDF